MSNASIIWCASIGEASQYISHIWIIALIMWPGALYTDDNDAGQQWWCHSLITYSELALVSIIQKQKTVTFIYHAIMIYVQLQIYPQCHIYSTYSNYFMYIYESYVSLYTSYNSYAIYNMARSTSTHTFHTTDICPSTKMPITLHVYIYCISTSVYILTPHYCTNPWKCDELQHSFTILLHNICQQEI